MQEARVAKPNTINKGWSVQIRGNTSCEKNKWCTPNINCQSEKPAGVKSVASTNVAEIAAKLIGKLAPLFLRANEINAATKFAPSTAMPSMNEIWQLAHTAEIRKV